MPNLNMRLRPIDEARLTRLANRYGGQTAAIRYLLEAADARNDEAFAWELANHYGGPSDHPALTVTVSRDLVVTTSTSPAGEPLTQYALPVARREAGRIVIELHGLTGDPDFAGVVLPVGVIAAAGGSITVEFEDLAPSLQPESA